MQHRVGEYQGVALRKESVDRNTMRRDFKRLGLVALRKESVDRNILANAEDQILPGVALRKESVDRNDFPVVPAELTTLSLSARRAWIEIYLWVWMGGLSWSLSARRAWIEICCVLWLLAP